MHSFPTETSLSLVIARWFLSAFWSFDVWLSITYSLRHSSLLSQPVSPIFPTSSPIQLQSFLKHLAWSSHRKDPNLHSKFHLSFCSLTTGRKYLIFKVKVGKSLFSLLFVVISVLIGWLQRELYGRRETVHGKQKIANSEAQPQLFVFLISYVGHLGQIAPTHILNPSTLDPPSAPWIDAIHSRSTSEVPFLDHVRFLGGHLDISITI